MNKLPDHKRLRIARKVAEALLVQKEDVLSPRIEVSWSTSSKAQVGSATLNVILYNGDVDEDHIGFIELIGFNDVSSMSRNCGPSFTELKENQGLQPSNSVPIWSVYMAYLKEGWRGKGLGKLLYQEAIEALRSKGGSFFMVPWSCLAIGGTTGEAQRVWESLKAQYPNSHNNVLFIR